jgi:hypothetical protein
MKTFLLLAVSFSIALAQVVKAEDQDTVKPPKTRAKVTQTTRPVKPTGPRINHVTPTGPHINQKTVQANQYHPKVQSTARIHTKPTIPNAHAPRTSTTVQANTSVQKKNWQNQTNQNTTVQKKNWQNQNNQNMTVQKKNWQNQNNQNMTVQKKNWQNQTWHNNSWTQARHRYHHEHHNHNWWRSHFTRFALFGSGYYFWDGGYWYPAYGYDSGYNTYDYNEPIYGYNDLDPGQVVSRVQTQLQQLGYYRHAVDGRMGPMTRAAIANYQRDNGLSITSAIDGPTLNSLGLG